LGWGRWFSDDIDGGGNESSVSFGKGNGFTRVGAVGLATISTAVVMNHRFHSGKVVVLLGFVASMLVAMISIPKTLRESVSVSAAITPPYQPHNGHHNRNRNRIIVIQTDPVFWPQRNQPSAQQDDILFKVCIPRKAMPRF